jgi:ribosome-associated protein
MEEDKQIIDNIVKGIQERKGKKIVIVDMTKLTDRACSYFIICECDSTTHVSSISDSIRDYVRKELKIKPFAVDGTENALWIAIDYGQILVHVFHRETRTFYDLEHLWSDAKLVEISDLA